MHAQPGRVFSTFEPKKDMIGKNRKLENPVAIGNMPFLYGKACNTSPTGWVGCCE